MNKLNQYISLGLILGLGLFSDAFSQERLKDSLAYYTELAIENNPGIKSQEFIQEAYLEKIPQAGAFQDAEITLSGYTESMDIVGGRSIGNISIMQGLPWFGTRKAARTEATHMANAQTKQYQEAVDNLILQVSTQWYAMQKLQEQLRNNQENKNLLEQLEQLALRRYSSSTSSSGSMSDVLRVQLELVELENNIQSFESQIRAEKAKFNALLNRDTKEEVMLGKEIQKINFVYAEADVLAAIQANNPALAIIEEESLAYKAKSDKDRKLSYPKIGIGVEYMLIGKTSDPMLAMGSMNGKDMIMPMLSISLPLFRKKYNSQQKESKLYWQASEQNLKNTYNSLVSEYQALKNELEDSERFLKLYDKQTELAQTTYNLIVKEFATGKSDLTNVIQVQRQLLEFQLKKAESLANYNKIVVSIQKLLSENR